MSQELKNIQKTIVLVDAEEVIHLICDEEITEVFGDKIKLVCFFSAKEALNYLLSNNADLVISSIIMPGMKGLDFLREVKSLYHDIPFIICSAVTAYKGDPRSADADAYVVKSSDLTELIETIGRLLGIRQNLSYLSTKKDASKC